MKGSVLEATTRGAETICFSTTKSLEIRHKATPGICRVVLLFMKMFTFLKKEEKKSQVLQTLLVATQHHRIKSISSLAGFITGRKKHTNA
jgi:hypothetical protein